MRPSSCCLVLATFLAAGCGQKGPLVKPGTAHAPVATVPASPPAPAPAPAAAAPEAPAPVPPAPRPQR
jgi:2-oxoglutarate dehydrogenase E2 component (dihydrolipoamide succinyltransferase)